MSNQRRIKWNGTVRALPLREQLRAVAIARCEALSVTPSDYAAWLSSAISTHDMTERQTILASGSPTSIRSCVGLINGSTTCRATIGLEYFC